ncbi:hypothetical protein [uncultured Novosphingobium sp.]|uniref:hypothetical protein n=1 Tax=uncultured Novosphingobium sp. TaxID=292277 RepID=UPI003748A286
MFGLFWAKSFTSSGIEMLPWASFGWDGSCWAEAIGVASALATAQIAKEPLIKPLRMLVFTVSFFPFLAVN